MSDMTLSEELTWRGFVNQTTFKDIRSLDGKPLTFYWGVDPSASSMQIGNFAIAMMIRHFINHGHKAILLLGGATGMIGDPDGKVDERNLKTLDEITANKTGIANQYKKIFDGQNFTLVDNYGWFKEINYLNFLRDVGKHVPMRQMLGRDFVQTRLAEEGAGISYAEFSYVLIQAYDFLQLHLNNGATLQVCGSDQWGNSIAGVDLIRRITGDETHVWSAPLVINNSTGVKFGKSEAGAVWLDPEKTSVYQFYQFWLNVDDAGVEDYLKIYTLLKKQEIDYITADFAKNTANRIAQKTLAYEVTKLVHGELRADAARHSAEVLFGGSNEELTEEDYELLKIELPFVEAEPGEWLAGIMVKAGLVGSSSGAKRLVAEGAVSANGVKVSDVGDLSLRSGYNLIKCGKNRFAVVEQK